MSAYVVDDKTINNIVSSLDHARGNGSHTCPAPKNIFTHVINGEIVISTPEELGQRMRKLNEDAVKYRYPDSDDLPGPCDKDGKLKPYHYRFQPATTPIRLLKSIRCFLYQCSEGDFDTCDLFKALDKYSLRLAYHIVTNSKEYDDAPWD